MVWHHKINATCKSHLRLVYTVLIWEGLERMHFVQIKSNTIMLERLVKPRLCKSVC